jgi:hypothetical protein
MAGYDSRYSRKESRAQYLERMYAQAEATRARKRKETEERAAQKRILALKRAEIKKQKQEQKEVEYQKRAARAEELGISWLEYGQLNARYRKYGLTVEDYVQMRDSQGGKCANTRCENQFTKFEGCVDHCHKSGKIRGILCQYCNKALGNVKDSTDRLQGLIEYLL